MKKLFRFQYEPCNGTCYAPEDKFFEDLKKVPDNKLKKVVDQVVNAHDRICNNPNMRFGVDFDENSNLYIGNFMKDQALDLFTSNSFIDVVNDLTTHVLNVVPTPQTGYDNLCEFGEGHENLAEMIMTSIGR